jgi:hypothetical protein
MRTVRHEWDWPPSRQRKRRPTIEIIPPEPEWPRLQIAVSLSRPARSWGQRLLDGYLALLVITLKAFAGAVCGIALVVILYLMKVILTL